ncbi:hypothetical protein [Pyrococcus kukulkanii]|uniref:Uncharacterized protein n=1 Tax=Pyrococcus kukulkanii TaxID=1609559 RepID=A0ABV4T5S7_9EURY
MNFERGWCVVIRAERVLLSALVLAMLVIPMVGWGGVSGKWFRALSAYGDSWDTVATWVLGTVTVVDYRDSGRGSGQVFLSVETGGGYSVVPMPYEFGVESSVVVMRYDENWGEYVPADTVTYSGGAGYFIAVGMDTEFALNYYTDLCRGCGFTSVAYLGVHPVWDEYVTTIYYADGVAFAEEFVYFGDLATVSAVIGGSTVFVPYATSTSSYRGVVFLYGPGYTVISDRYGGVTLYGDGRVFGAPYDITFLSIQGVGRFVWLYDIVTATSVRVITGSVITRYFVDDFSPLSTITLPDVLYWFIWDSIVESFRPTWTDVLSLRAVGVYFGAGADGVVTVLIPDSSYVTFVNVVGEGFGITVVYTRTPCDVYVIPLGTIYVWGNSFAVFMMNAATIGRLSSVITVTEPLYPGTVTFTWPYGKIVVVGMVSPVSGSVPPVITTTTTTVPGGYDHAPTYDYAEVLLVAFVGDKYYSVTPPNQVIGALYRGVGLVLTGVQLLVVGYAFYLIVGYARGRDVKGRLVAVLLAVFLLFTLPSLVDYIIGAGGVGGVATGVVSGVYPAVYVGEVIHAPYLAA